jgi:energy-coupling factor transporter ATP-binding protein EcfA2
VGRNGAGKTTLLRSVAGLHEPSRGKVLIDGRPPVVGESVAYCPQTPDVVLFKERVDDEIASTVASHPTAPSSDLLLDQMGLADLAHHHPRDLSAGQRALVAIASIAATGAPILLLDEPTRGLDPDAKKRLVEFARARAASGAVVVATHDVELAAELATRVVMVASGDIVANGTPSEVLGDSPVFAPQTARVFGPMWLTPDQVAAAL